LEVKRAGEIAIMGKKKAGSEDKKRQKKV